MSTLYIQTANSDIFTVVKLTSKIFLRRSTLASPSLSVSSPLTPLLLGLLSLLSKLLLLHPQLPLRSLRLARLSLVPSLKFTQSKSS